MYDEHEFKHLCEREEEPHIRIDKDAIRFTYNGGGTNCFWEDLQLVRRVHIRNKHYVCPIKKFFKQLVKGFKKFWKSIRE